MTVQLRTGSSSLIDVLDRVLDKGIVIDAWMRVSLAGLDLVEVEARVVVASIQTYLANARALYGVHLVSPPGLVNNSDVREDGTGRGLPVAAIFTPRNRTSRKKSA